MQKIFDGVNERAQKIIRTSTSPKMNNENMKR